MTNAEQLEIDCGESLTIAEVGSVYADLLVPLAEGKAVKLNVSKLERIDTAGVQLIYSLYKEAQTQGHTVEWDQPSEAFCQSVGLLGLAQQMNINDNKD